MIRLEEHHRWSSIDTFVREGSILYIFRRSIAQAKRCGALLARAQILVQGEEVEDIPAYAASLVWRRGTPFLFPGSLTNASKRGRRYKIGYVQALRELHEVERRAGAKFWAQYGNGIGEEKGERWWLPTVRHM